MPGGRRRVRLALPGSQPRRQQAVVRHANVRQSREGSRALLTHGPRLSLTLLVTPRAETGADMQLTLVGLGRMGGNMTRRLALGGHQVFAVDPNAGARDALAGVAGVSAVGALDDALTADSGRRVVWLMLPAGDVTETVLVQARDQLTHGDLIVDGGNADYRDSIRRAELLADAGVGFVDVGVSGGVWGLDEGYGLMAGGADDDIALLSPVLQTLAPTPDTGWVHAGPVGAGHFTKMVHNGIEYGAMQALAEGFALLHARSDLVKD